MGKRWNKFVSDLARETTRFVPHSAEPGFDQPYVPDFYTVTPGEWDDVWQIPPQFLVDHEIPLPPAPFDQKICTSYGDLCGLRRQEPRDKSLGTKCVVWGGRKTGWVKH